MACYELDWNALSNNFSYLWLLFVGLPLACKKIQMFHHLISLLFHNKKFMIGINNNVKKEIKTVVPKLNVQ